MYIKRKIEDKINRYLKRPEIIAISGPRQCGKTTTLKKVFGNLQNAAFLSFEDQEILSLFEKNIKQFAATYIKKKNYIFIDEFQYAKNGGKLLKYLYDEHHAKIIISGSSAVDLTVKAIKYLVGRIFVFEMLPLDFGEYLSFRDENYFQIYDKNKIDLKNPKPFNLAEKQIATLGEYFEEYCVWGGYPAVVTSKNKEDKKEVLKNIYNTYFLRDVKDILGLIDDYKLSRLIKALAFQAGSMIEYNELSNVSEYSYATLKKYLNFLDKTYICGFISPYFKNKRKEIVKNKKIYFYDTGLRNYVADDFRNLKDRPDGGNLLENACWKQLIKNGKSANYWRDKNKNEVDFIVETGEGKIAAIEVKFSRRKCGFPAAFISNYGKALRICAYLDSTDKKDGGLLLPISLM